MPRLPLALVLAVADDGALGLRGKVPWHIPEDLKHFRALTVGHAVIMGRRTWDEVGKPLPNRRNLVITRQAALRLEGAEVMLSLEVAIALARNTDAEPRVIGGAEIFALALPLATTIYLTEVHRTVEADRYFHLDRQGFQEAERRPGQDPTVSFVTLRRAD
jgi:dihydrofolate reductase